MKSKLNGLFEEDSPQPKQPGGGRNILYLEDSSEISVEESCFDRVYDDGILPTQAIHITYEENPDELLRTWRRVANGATVPDLGIIPVNEATRSAAAVEPSAPWSPQNSGSEPTDREEWPDVKPVTEADDILAIGGNLKQFLDLFSEAATPTAICFDSLTAALEYTDAETLFRFLHLVTRQIEREGAQAHYHLDAAAVERSTVSTFAVLFDEVVWAGETRGESFESAAAQSTAAESATTAELPSESREVMEESTSTTDLLMRTEPWLWVIAIATFGVGDIFTSVIGLQSGMAVEASPVAAQVLEAHGVGFIYIVKIAMFGMFFLLWKVIPRPHRVGVPMGLGGLGLFITAWNLWILSLATF